MHSAYIQATNRLQDPSKAECLSQIYMAAPTGRSLELPRDGKEASTSRLATRRLAHGPTVDNQGCITRDTIRRMAEVSIRDLRNHGGDVVDRAARGEQITITRSGKAVAELRAISPLGLSAEALLSRWRRLPSVDPVVFREDVDRLLDSSL